MSLLFILTPKRSSSQRRLSVQADGLFHGAVDRKYISNLISQNNLFTASNVPGVVPKFKNIFGIVSGWISYGAWFLNRWILIADLKSAITPSRSINIIFKELVISN